MWYARSLDDRDIHQGVLSRGQVLTACRVVFSPLRKSDPALSFPRVLSYPNPDPEQVCPRCWAAANAQVVIPATCPTHPALTSVLAYRLQDGRIGLESHAPGGCALTVQGVLLFDVLAEWL